MKKVFAYIRVSSEDQSVDRQIDAIKDYCRTKELDIDERDIFKDKKSGKNFDREGYRALKQCLRQGDELIVKELDRLGRNKEETKGELDYFKKNNIRVRILNIPTTLIDLPEGQEWVFDMINNILVEVLAAIAEEERNKIKQRQKEGINSAKARGKHLGRPRAEFPKGWEEYYSRWKANEITAKKFMQDLKIKRTTFYKLVNLWQSNTQRAKDI